LYLRSNVRHLQHYLNIFLKSSTFEITTSSEFEGREQACLVATDCIKGGSTVLNCCGILAELSDEEEEELRRAAKNFSVVKSARDGKVYVLCGILRFSDSICDAAGEMTSIVDHGSSYLAKRNHSPRDKLQIRYGDSGNSYFGSECQCSLCKPTHIHDFAGNECLDCREILRDSVGRLQTRSDTRRCARCNRHFRMFGASWPARYPQESVIKAALITRCERLAAEFASIIDVVSRAGIISTECCANVSSRLRHIDTMTNEIHEIVEPRSVIHENGLLEATGHRSSMRVKRPLEKFKVLGVPEKTRKRQAVKRNYANMDASGRADVQEKRRVLSIETVEETSADHKIAMTATRSLRITLEEKVLPEHDEAMFVKYKSANDDLVYLKSHPDLYSLLELEDDGAGYSKNKKITHWLVWLRQMEQEVDVEFVLRQWTSDASCTSSKDNADLNEIQACREVLRDIESSVLDKHKATLTMLKHEQSFLSSVKASSIGLSLLNLVKIREELNDMISKGMSQNGAINVMYHALLPVGRNLETCRTYWNTFGKRILKLKNAAGTSKIFFSFEWKHAIHKSTSALELLTNACNSNRSGWVLLLDERGSFYAEKI
jgi:REP element-mobilizing transposase RayT